MAASSFRQIAPLCASTRSKSWLAMASKQRDVQEYSIDNLLCLISP
jgi:hypothetical protein